MKSSFFLFAAVLLIATPALGQDAYLYFDEAGRPVLSDHPPADGKAKPLELDPIPEAEDSDEEAARIERLHEAANLLKEDRLAREARRDKLRREAAEDARQKVAEEQAAKAETRHAARWYPVYPVWRPPGYWHPGYHPRPPIWRPLPHPPKAEVLPSGGRLNPGTGGRW